MNYLKQILAFNQRQLSNPLSQGQYTLWHALMSVNNECAWQEWFTVANLRLELFTGLSRQGIDKARNTLKQLGFIDYKSNGTKATSYKITKLYDDSLQDSLQDSGEVADKVVAEQFTNSGRGSLQNSGTLNKQNKTKLNKTKVNNISAEAEASDDADSQSKLTKKEQQEADFEALWKLYPRKSRKNDAYKAYLKSLKEGATNEEIQSGILAYKKQIQVQKTDMQFVAQGGTWFNQQRWKDEYDTGTAQSPANDYDDWDEFTAGGGLHEDDLPF